MTTQFYKYQYLQGKVSPTFTDKYEAASKVEKCTNLACHTWKVAYNSSRNEFQHHQYVIKNSMNLSQQLEREAWDPSPHFGPDIQAPCVRLTDYLAKT